MEFVKSILISAAEWIDMIGMLILIYGFCKTLIKYVLIEASSLKTTQVNKLQGIRSEIGIYILLALDFLIASDIINTIRELTQEELIVLFAMIILRTIIGYFLGKEVQEIEGSKQKDEE